MNKWVFVAALCFLHSLLFGQSFQEGIIAQLEDIHIQLFTPAEQAVFEIKADQREYFPADFIIDHEDKVEILVEYFSWAKDSLAITNPNIKNGIRLAQLMDNIEESNISLHRLGIEDLILYGADWATQATFRPKREFSEKAYCQLLTLYKEDVGLIFLYLLFDDMEKYKDDWRYVIGFGSPVEVDIK